MKSYRKELWFETPTRRAFINITQRVAKAVRKSEIREGLCLVNAMHITASVYINDDEPGLLADYEDWLEGLAPHEPISRYRHNRTGEDNGDAHLKRQVMGREVVVAITNGKLDFGPWEQIPICRIAFTTPKDKRAQLVKEGEKLYLEALERLGLEVKK